MPVAEDLTTFGRSSVAVTAGLPKLSTASPWAPAASSARAHSTRPNCGAWGGLGCGGCVVEEVGEYLCSQVQSGCVRDIVGFVWVSATGKRNIRGKVE